MRTKPLNINSLLHPGDDIDIRETLEGNVLITIEHNKGPAQEWQIVLTPAQWNQVRAWAPSSESAPAR